MNTFFEKPSVRKPLNFFFAYLLFGLFAFLGLEIVFNLHSAMFRISLLATTRIGVGNFFYVWGGFFLFAVYALFVVLLESIMNKAAKAGRVLTVSVRVFAIEAVLALLTIIVPIVAQWILLPV